MYRCTLSKVYEITISLEDEENDNQGSEDDIFSTENPDMENVGESETSETEENQTEQTSEGDSEGTEGETGEQSEGEPAEAEQEPTATPESYVLLIQETNEHLANIELMHGALFGVLGLFLGVYLIHDFFDSVKKI